MDLTIPTYAKSISAKLNSRHAQRAAPTAAPQAVPPTRRRLSRLFRRETPSTFHRCLAVHIHYAQRASALD